MTVFILSICNGLIFAIYCYFISYIMLQQNKINIKNIFLALIPFFIMYYFILCLLDSIYAIFFLGLCVFLFIRKVFNESMFMSLFLSFFIHVIKYSTKIIILELINQDNLYLINTYKTIDWNAFYINLLALVISSIIIFIFKNQARKIIKYVSSLHIRKQLLLITIYSSFILILIYQPPSDLLSLRTLTDLVMIFTVTGIGVFSISSELEINALNKHYQEIFEYSKANGELLTNYKMQVHENRNRLLMIKGMLDGPKKELKKYIDTLLKEMQDNKNSNNYWLTELRYIPLPGIRNFINYKLIKLKELGSEIEVFVSSDLETIKTSVLSKNDYNQLTTILGVIMDNMIESISETKEKLVSINIYIEDDKIYSEFVNTYTGTIDLSRLNEVGYTTKGAQHGVGIPLVNKIIRSNNRFECTPEIMDNFFIQHFTIKLFDKNNLQKIPKK